uniref:Integrase zinc-binding domain-containing protein n=1 Tax=Octopus bimaculoides TaxID=37653 RepID=A0A0L8G2U1_OCTBM
MSLEWVRDELINRKEIIQERFKSLLNKYEIKENGAMLTRKKLLSLIAEVKNAKIAYKNVPCDCWLIKRHVLEVQGIEKLIVSVIDAKLDVFYCSSNALFDILYKMYTSIGHSGRDHMIEELNHQCKNITQNEIKLFLSVCELSQQKRNKGKKGTVVKPMVFSHFNSRCQVDLIDFQFQPDGNYKYIFVYQNFLTKFVDLRPLQTKRAPGSCSIYFYCLVIYVFCSLTTARNSVINIDNLKITWLELKIVMVNQSIVRVKVALTTGMQNNQSTSWSHKLRFIQFMKNRVLHSGIKRTPYEGSV